MSNLFILLFFLLASCATAHTVSLVPPLGKSEVPHAAAAKENAPPADKTISSTPPDRIADPDAYYHYILGNLYEIENNLPKAYFEYKSALILDPKSTTLMYEISTLAVREGDLATAEEYIQSLLEINPNHIEGLGLLGDIYANQGKSEKAISAYKKLLTLKPDFNEAYIEVASLYLKEKKYADAEKTVISLIDRRPNSPIGYYYLGRILFEEQKYKESIQKYNEAIKRDNTYEPAWMGIGMVYETEGAKKEALDHYHKFLASAGPNHREARYRIIHLLFEEKDYVQAKRELEELLKLDPNDIEGNFRLALLYAEQKDFAKAIQLLSTAIERRGNDPRLVDYLGSLFEANNEMDKAIEAYLKVIEVDKTYTDAYIHLAAVYLKQKKSDSALKILEDARVANPQKEDILFSGEGWVYLQFDRFNESLEAFRRAIQINPNNPDFHYDLGQAYDKMNNFDAMEKEMRKTIELDPGYANALNYLGYSYADKNIKLKEAHELITRALKVRPNDGFIIDSLAWVYYRQGELDKAMSELKKALIFVPDDPTIHEHLGEVYYKKNIKQEAKEEFLKSIEIDPSNQKLIDRFKEYGLIDPKSEERIQKALKKVVPPSDPSSTKTNQADSSNSKI